MIKKTRLFWITLILVLFLWPWLSGSVQAQPGTTPTPTSALERTPVPSLRDVVSLSMLGAEERRLTGPFDATSITFSTPANWKLIPGAELQFHMQVFFTGGDRSASGFQRLAGALQLEMNGVNLESFLLERSGEYSISIPIPVEALIPSTSDGRHKLNISLISEESCEFDFDVSIIIDPTSRFILPHEMVSPPTDLTLLPRPIFQKNAFLPMRAVIVVPDNPTESELQAAFAVSAGFGWMSEREMPVTFITASQLRPDVRSSHHLIFVGKPSAIPLLKRVDWAAPVGEGGFQIDGAGPDDGVLQMALSPWNKGNLLMLVSGNSDLAVMKAGQAVYFGTIQITQRPDLALVAEVHPTRNPPVVMINRTFADLGYEIRSLRRAGINWAEYYFYVPPGQIVSDDAYLELVFNHSALLDFGNSGLAVTLNDILIGSARFTEESTQVTRVRISVPSSVIRPGNNKLLFQVQLLPLDVCTNTDFSNLWVNILSESLLHLPMDPSPTTFARGTLDLGNYPQFLTFNPTIGQLVFVLPSEDVVSWGVASQIAFDLGLELERDLSNLQVSYETIPEDIRQDGDFILIGRPSSLPLVAELGDALPIPFQNGNDTPSSTRGLRVDYRILPGVSVGYVELLTAPWNDGHLILTVLGNSDTGLQSAGNALTISQLRSRLSGNFAVINGQQIVSGDTRLSASPALAIATVVSEGELAVEDLGPPPEVQKPGWILPAIGVTSLATVLILVIVLVSAWHQSRQSR
ncbi:MAG: cellulose biosynthesis cyclic di-GMP-binding regulatory protein BcsB [Anaerolineales bacterium]